MLLAFMLSAAATVTTAPAPAKPLCQVSRIEQADTQQLKPHVARLGEMPPAKHLIAVLHTENRCEKPVVVSEQVGMNHR